MNRAPASLKSALTTSWSRVEQSLQRVRSASPLLRSSILVLALVAAPSTVVLAAEGDVPDLIGEEDWERDLQMDREARRQVQESLNERGFFVGKPDGIFGPRTRQAIRQWQQSIGDSRPSAYLQTGDYALVLNREAFVEVVDRWNRECMTGNDSLCIQLGELHELGIRFERNLRIAAELYEKACDRENTQACINMANTYLRGGPGLPSDPARGMEVLERGCKLGMTCAQLASAYKDGRGGIKDIERAVELYESVCDTGEGLSCEFAGNIHLRGTDGFPKDPEAAVALYERGCTHGWGDACEDAAALLTEGHPLPRNLPRATELYQAGCLVGNETSCEALRKLRN